MEKLLVCLLVFITAAHAESSFGDPSNPCYKCSEFNDQGQGFMEYDAVMCCYYWECYRVNKQAVTSILRACPDGEYWDPDYGPNGAPCTSEMPHLTCDPACTAPAEGDIVEGDCDLVPNTPDGWIFGLMVGSVFYETGRCRGGIEVFDPVSCTCIGRPTPCKCLADIWLIADTDDHSCQAAQTFVSGDDINFPGAPIPGGQCGAFPGTPANSHVNDPLFNGLYANCFVNKLSVGLFMKVNSIPPPGVDRGAVYYASCVEGGGFEAAAYGIGVRRTAVGNNLLVVGNIMQYEVSEQINVDQWYYVAMVYKRKFTERDNLHLYVYNLAQEAACRTGGPCPGPADTEDTDKQCIHPRACGLEVGFTGTSVDGQEFFDGHIGRVQVAHDLNIMGCILPRRKPNFKMI